MNLPPLPEPDGFLCQRLFYKVEDVDEYCTHPHHDKWAEDQMREYGALCRRMALEEAAKFCESQQVNHSPRGTRMFLPFNSECMGTHEGIFYAKAIRELAK